MTRSRSEPQLGLDSSRLRPADTTRLQDIESDTGYDTRRRGPDGVRDGVSQTAVYDTGGSATSTTPTAFRGGSVVEGVLAREHQRPGARGGERVVVLEVRVQHVSGV